MPFKIHTKAIIIGILTGLVLGFLISPFETVFLFGPALIGTSLHIVSLAFGSLATLIAAYLTARFSLTDKFANVMVFWVINEIFGLLSLFVLAPPLWYNIAGMFAVFIACILGWYLEGVTRTK